MHKLTKSTITIALFTMTATAFAANTSGNVSTGNNAKNTATKFVLVGDAAAGNKYDGKAGINIVHKHAESGSINNKFQSFEKIASRVGKPFTRSVIEKTADGVIIGRMYNMPKAIAWIPFIPEHRDAGRMSFAQVGNMDVWFGDWEDVPRNSKNPVQEASKYTVYYAGTKQTKIKDLPNGQVSYRVQGINKHHNNSVDVLKGKFTADFTKKTVIGQIKRSDLDIGIDAKIIGAGFKGGATATSNGRTIAGHSEGKFYGAQAAGLAGMATFNKDHSKDTAFGGTKQ
ncbi:transferrin-binding protein-like solute binding protein [Bisgaard Taxon 45]|uniref:Transferrin-binding protein-like solute binding protein n=1 Tax=Bisgaard Taxon 45 TaxID=304289 RepID=A0ABT9KCB7_9PAST|nr:transferrin-binding protein-like solute binding protein [Bisgaard Taxon 45]